MGLCNVEKCEVWKDNLKKNLHTVTAIEGLREARGFQCTNNNKLAAGIASNLEG